jgi:hypothetical protein
MELTVSGSNTNVGPYVYKCSFVVRIIEGAIGTSNFTTLTDYSHQFGSVSVTFSGQTTSEMRITVATPVNGSPLGQTYITTLVAYPACTIGGGMNDWAIEAI